MKSKKTFFIIILIFVLLLGGASTLYSLLSREVSTDQLAAQQPQEQVSDNGTNDAAKQTVSAPDFTVYDKDGNEVNLSDFVGKPIVLNFWASWCGPCQMEMPDFQKKYLEFGNEIHFLMINMTDGSRETVHTASAFLAERGYTFPVFYDTAFQAATAYGAYSLPTTFFIDANGHPIARATGAIDGETLQRGIDMIKQ